MQTTFFDDRECARQRAKRASDREPVCMCVSAWRGHALENRACMRATGWCLARSIGTHLCLPLHVSPPFLQRILGKTSWRLTKVHLGCRTAIAATTITTITTATITAAFAIVAIVGRIVVGHACAIPVTRRAAFNGICLSIERRLRERMSGALARALPRLLAVEGKGSFLPSRSNRCSSHRFTCFVHRNTTRHAAATHSPVAPRSDAQRKRRRSGEHG
jgi:hypothetical protein